MPREYISKPPEQRFWPKVKTQESGCWEWTGALTNGYGVFSDGHRMVRAHRFSYELVNGTILNYMTIDHLCRNHACVNPLHLEVVTRGENILRGVGLTAQNAAKTSCINGHSFDAQNTYFDSHGWRYCRICRKEAAQRLRDRRHTQC